MADYGLDPSVVNYVQGMPPTTTVAPPVADTSSYGLDPSVIAGLQNGFAPQPQQTLMENPNAPAPVTVGNTSSAPATPPSAPPPQAPVSRPGGLSSPGTLAQANNSASTLLPLMRFGVDPSIAGAPSEIANQPDSVPSVTGGQLQTEQPQGAPTAPGALPVANSPDQVIGTVAPLTDKQVAATNKVYAAQQAQAAAFANSPEGIAQKADAQNLAAIDKQRQANADADAAASAQNAALLKATQDSNERQAQQEKIAAAQRAQDQATTQQYAQQYAQQIKDASDYKVNTDRSIGAGGVIAMALSGIGDALDHRHGPNSALQIMNEAADKRIADQWAQKKALGDKAAGTKDVLELSRQTASDDRQDQDVQKAAILTDYNNQVKLAAAQAADPLMKARAVQLSAGLDQQVANLTTGLAQRKLDAQKTAQDQANKQAQIGVSYADLAQRKLEHQDTLKAQDRDFALRVGELAAQGDTKAAAALQAQQGEVQDRGAMVPVALNPDGTPHYEPAMQEDGKTPWLAEKGKVSEELTGFRAATIDGVKAIDTLRQKRSEFSTNEQFDNWIAHNEEGRALMQAQARALLDIHQASGINRLSGDAVDLAKKELTGGLDADSVKNLMAELDTARGTLVDQLDSRMRAANYTGKKIDFADPLKFKAAPTPDEKQLAMVLAKPGQTDAGVKGSGLAGAAATKASADQGLQTQKATIDGWGAVLNDPKATPEDKKKASDFLDKAQSSALTKNVQDYALSVQTQAAVNARAGGAAAAPEPTAISSGSAVRDTSYGGTAQTAPAQAQIEQAPIDALASQAIRAPAGSAERADARAEILRRAANGDKAAMKARIQIVGSR